MASLSSPCLSPNLLPPFNRVSTAMLGMRNQFKILKSIISLIVVNVMNVFTSSKFASKMLFHYQSMFKNIPSIYHMTNVTLKSFCSKTLFSSKGYVRISPSFKLSKMRVTQLLRSNLINTILNRAFSPWKFSCGMVTRSVTILLSPIFSVNSLKTRLTFNGYHGVNLS